MREFDISKNRERVNQFIGKEELYKLDVSSVESLLEEYRVIFDGFHGVIWVDLINNPQGIPRKGWDCANNRWRSDDGQW